MYLGLLLILLLRSYREFALVSVLSERRRLLQEEYLRFRFGAGGGVL